LPAVLRNSAIVNKCLLIAVHYTVNWKLYVELVRLSVTY
jgi:hypothetical protein